MKGQWGRLAGYFLGTLLVSAVLTYGLPRLGGGSWLPDLLSREGAAIDDLFWGLLGMSVIIFAMVGAVVIYSIVHFRAEPGDLSDGEHIHGNARLEIAWIVVPSIIVAVIAVLSYVVLEDNEVGLYEKAAAKDRGAATMQVDVRGFSFGWAFRYADREGEPLGPANFVPANELVLPVGEVVRFNVMSCSGSEALGRLREQVARRLSAGEEETRFAEIAPGICEREWDLTTDEDRAEAEAEAELLYRATQRKADGERLTTEERDALEDAPQFGGDQQYIDVNHAFWVPEARLKIDAVAGLRTYVQWEPTEVTTPEDRYQVVCAELCGSGHNAMRNDMCVVSKGAFEWWLALDEDGRADASCVNLRLVNCLGDIGDLQRDAALEAVAKLSKDDPDARCDEAKEAVA